MGMHDLYPLGVEYPFQSHILSASEMITGVYGGGHGECEEP